jgi:two-component system cell cycle sensor histidine kinase/response regulator CckA
MCPPDGNDLLRQEIAERKRAEKALRESEEQYRAILDDIEDGYFEVDVTGNPTFFNDPLCRIIGYSREEMMVMHSRQYMDSKTAKKAYQTCSQVYTTGTPTKGLVWEITRKDGTKRLVEASVSLIRNPEGEPAGFRGIVRDVTKRKALEETWKRYAFIANASREFMTLISRDHIYEAVNESFCRAHSKTRDEILGSTVADIWGEERYLTQIKQHLDKCFARNEVHYQAQFEFATLGLRYFDVAYYPYCDDEGTVTHVAVVSRDITERTEAEKEKARMQTQLVQVQKMEAIGMLAGGVAHDFNNLLTVVQGYVDLALAKISKTDSLYDDLTQIQLAAMRAANLTHQLLLFSRKQPIEFAPLNINRTVDDLLRMLNCLIGEDVVISANLNPNLWPVRANIGNIEQVIMNLAVNAKDAMPEGGRLTLKTENLTLDEDHCKAIPEARPGKFVCLSVTDTGIGIDPEILQHIFEPFFTTKKAGKGTGLGLSVVYGIVQKHEGWISVCAEPEQGSTFKVYLPALPVKPRDKSKKATSPHECPGSGERILMVEDEDSIRTVFARALRENGYVVFEAASAEEALDILEREKAEFHLIFSDTILHNETGMQLVDLLLSREPDLPILLSSGYTDHRSQRSFVHERKLPFIQKPYDVAGLLRAIGEAIEPI